MSRNRSSWKKVEKGQIDTVYNNSSDAGNDDTNYGPLIDQQNGALTASN